MTVIEELFKEKANRVSFLELKYRDDMDFPLPVVTDNFVDTINKGEFEEEIDMVHVIEGMAYVLGTDKDFKYAKEYVEFLRTYSDSVEEYILYNGLKQYESGDIIDAGIYFRGLLALNEDNHKARFNYALVVEEIAKKKVEEDKDADDLVLKAIHELEYIIEKDENFTLAYYKLGYYYRYFQQFIKSKLTWEKFLNMDGDDSVKQEIREQIDVIEDEVNYEMGYTYFSYNEFGKALDSFLKLFPKQKDNWNVNYMVALCYKGIEEYDIAIEYLDYAIALSDEEPDLYNELGVVYFLKDDMIKAIDVLSKGIEKIDWDYKLYFNRGLGFVQLGEYKRALEDIRISYNLNPNDGNVIKQKAEIEKFLDTI